jgi:uncharacterized repeat protein (TIGR01451 family)
VAGRDIVCTFNNRPLGANLAVTTAVSTAAPTAGSTVTLTLTVTNLGLDPAQGATLTAALPAGLTLLSSTPSVGTYSAGTWTIGTLAVGTPITLTFTARVNDRNVGTTASAYSFTATVANTVNDPVLTNNSATAGITPPAPLLTFVKTADRTNARPGEVLTYTLVVTNTGTGAATSVSMLDPLSEFTAIGINAYGAGAPFSTTDSTPPSGLTLLAPEYSTNGTTWTYAPTSGGGGAAPGYDNNVRQWRLPFNGSLRPGGSLTVRFKTIVK